MIFKQDDLVGIPNRNTGKYDKGVVIRTNIKSLIIRYLDSGVVNVVSVERIVPWDDSLPDVPEKKSDEYEY